MTCLPLIQVGRAVVIEPKPRTWGGRTVSLFCFSAGDVKKMTPARLMSPDAALLRRYADEQSQEAFAELVHRHVDLVYSAALRRTGGDDHRAKDITQQVFTRVARQAHALSAYSVLTPWLYTATRNAAIDLLRSEARRRAREQEAQAMHHTISETLGDDDWAKLRPILDAAMDELGEHDRAAVLLRFFEQRSFVDMGAVLNLTQEAARMRTDRALNKLRALLAKRGINSTAAALATVLGGHAVAGAPAGLAGTIVSGAMASAAGTAAWVVGVIGFMNTTKFAVGTFVVASLLLVGASGYRVNAARHATESEKQASDQQAGLVTRLTATEATARQAEQQAIQLKEAFADVEPAAAERAQASEASAWIPATKGNQLLQRHPEVVRAYTDLIDASTIQRYGPFFKARGWTDVQIEQFKLLQRSIWSVSIDFGNSSPPVPFLRKETEGYYTNRGTLHLSLETALPRDEALARQYTLFGPGDELALAEWQATERVRNRVHDLAAALCFTAAPLLPQQAEQLAACLTLASLNSPPSAQAGEPFAGDRSVDLIDWDAVDPAARQILSAEQLPAWNNLATWGRASREAYLASEAVRAAKSKK